MPGVTLARIPAGKRALQAGTDGDCPEWPGAHGGPLHERIPRRPAPGLKV